jgi:archaellum biogenesis protein FlaJ (TadC family)
MKTIKNKKLKILSLISFILAIVYFYIGYKYKIFRPLGIFNLYIMFALLITSGMSFLKSEEKIKDNDK